MGENIVTETTAILSALHQWIESNIPNLPLGAVGLVALADISTVARRTVLTGTSTLTDALILCPGFHRQQDAAHLNRGEYPACAAMTTGYVFRIENQATVAFLQTIGRPGQLTNLSVEDSWSKRSAWSRILARFIDFDGTSFTSSLAYTSAVALTMAVLTALLFLKDWPGVVVVSSLIFARSINIIVLRRRAVMGWKGQPEPGQKSDLIILVSQDKWIRMRGAVDDVKAITSGEWLRDATFTEDFFVTAATLLVYLNVVLTTNMSREGQILLAFLLLSSAALLGLANGCTDCFKMYGRVITVDGPREVFKRRLLLTRKLIRESGSSEWAVALGMAQRKDIEAWEKDEGDANISKSHSTKGSGDGPVIL